MRTLTRIVGQAILPAAAFQAARRLKAGGCQDWLPHSLGWLSHHRDMFDTP